MVKAIPTVRGARGFNNSPTIPSLSVPPCLNVEVIVTAVQQNNAEYKNMRESRRCRRTFLTRGSYAWVAGGTEGAVLKARLDLSARMGVDGAAIARGMVVVEEKAESRSRSWNTRRRPSDNAWRLSLYP